jgi:PAS domain S-box-containing protein
MGFTCRGGIFGSIILKIKGSGDIPNRRLLEAFVSQASVALLRRYARKLQKQSEERYRAVVESQTELIARFLPDGTHLFMNEPYCRYFNIDRATTTGKRFRPKVFDEDREKLALYFNSFSPDDPVLTMEHRITLDDGSVRWVQWNDMAFFDKHGRLEEYQSVGRDITDRKMAEQKLVQLYADLELRVAERTRELEEANADLTQFTYGVSHDLRTPLRSINGFSAILQKEHAAQLSDEAQDYLKRIRKTTVQMAAYVDGLLDFSRVRSKEIHRETVIPDQIAQSIFEELSLHLDDRVVNFIMDDLPPCNADPVLVRLVYSNLLGNAMKFTSTRNPAIIEVGSSQIENRTVYWVRDNGIGFEPGTEERIFSIFERAHGMNHYDGHGLGLALVRHAVLKHGGWVRAESELGKGASFFFSFG